MSYYTTMKNKTQIEWIKDELITKGEISRNYCLSKYCSRLGARINDLKKEGWEFETKTRNGDFFYVAKTVPSHYALKRAFRDIVLPELAKQLSIKL